MDRENSQRKQAEFSEFMKSLRKKPPVKVITIENEQFLKMNEIHGHMDKYRADYVTKNPKSTINEESDSLKTEAERIIKKNFPIIFGQPSTLKSLPIKRRAEVLFQTGKILNYSETFEPSCELLLKKAVKLDPNLSEAWLELGLCVAKNEEIDVCIECLQRSLSLKRTAKTLSSLAISLRLKANKLTNRKEKSVLREKATKLLNEAVKLDESLGISFLYLGTGYFVEFFSSDQTNPHLLELACQNYKKAQTCDDQKNNPELHLNYATALRYLEDFEEAYHHLNESCRFDVRNSLKCEERRESLIVYLEKFKEIIEKKGKLKPKRLQTLIEDLTKETPTKSNSIKAKVVGTISHDDIVPLTIALVDCTGSCFCATIYNCASNFGFVIGDTLTISNPQWKNIKNLNISTTSNISNIKWCRVASPRHLLRNGVPVSSSALAHATVTVEQA